MHKLQDNIGYFFKEHSLLEQALTHRSYSGAHNERLEFLGDAFLDFVVGDVLFHRYPLCKEGDLSRMRARIVCGENLASIGSELGLGSLLRLGSGEASSGGRDRSSNLANAVEALVAAVYLDGGIEAGRALIDRLFSKHLQNAASDTTKDAKTCLQEYLQSRRYDLPVYRLVQRSGKDHAAVFVVACEVAGLSLSASAEGTSVKKAELAAAEKLLAMIGKELK